MKASYFVSKEDVTVIFFLWFLTLLLCLSYLREHPSPFMMVSPMIARLLFVIQLLNNRFLSSVNLFCRIKKTAIHNILWKKKHRQCVSSDTQRKHNILSQKQNVFAVHKTRTVNSFYKLFMVLLKKGNDLHKEEVVISDTVRLTISSFKMFTSLSWWRESQKSKLVSLP